MPDTLSQRTKNSFECREREEQKPCLIPLSPSQTSHPYPILKTKKYLMSSIADKNNTRMMPSLKHLLLQKDTRDPLASGLVNKMPQGSVGCREIVDLLDHVLVGLGAPFSVPEGHVVGLGGGELHLHTPADFLAGHCECAPLCIGRCREKGMQRYDVE